MIASVAISTWHFGLRSVEKCGTLAVAGVPALDAIELGIRIAEDDPEVTSVGYGGLPNEEGIVELDAAVFDGPRHRMGSVASLREIRNAISVARLVMEKTPHAMLIGEGALQLALKHGFKRENLLSEKARMRWEEWKRNPTSPYKVEPFVSDHDTICILLRDSKENLYGGCSTSGLAWKPAGRVGDTPIIGSGLYVDNEVGAAAATGVGELAIAHCVSFAVVELMRNGHDPEDACGIVLRRVFAKELSSEPRQLGLIALRKDGKLGFSCLQKGFQAAIYYEGKAALIDVESIGE